MAETWNKSTDVNHSQSVAVLCTEACFMVCHFGFHNKQVHAITCPYSRILPPSMLSGI
jgi:hypothetical protein